jgi:Predicted nucleotidyltransferases
MVTLDLNKIKNYLSSQPVTEAWLFGSFARGEQRSDSDIDILVSFDKSAKVGLLRHADILLGLQKLLNRNVDLVPVGARYPEGRREIDKYKILIYERGS